MIRRTGQVFGFLIAVMALCLLLLAVLPGPWLAKRASVMASAWLDLSVEIDDLTVTPFSLAPTAALRTLSISATSDTAEFHASEITVSLDLPALFKGDAVLDRLFISDASLDGRIDEQGLANWYAPVAGKPFSLVLLRDSLRDTKINDLVLDSLHVGLVNSQLDTRFSLEIEGVASTSDASKMSRVHLAGFADGQAVKLDAEFSFLGDILQLPATGKAPITLDVTASVGDDQVVLKGSVGEPATLRKVDAVFSARISSPGHWQAFVPIPLPDLPPLALAGELTRDNEDWLLRQVAGQFGNTDINGEIRADSSSKPMKLDARLLSSQLAIDELMRWQVIELMPLPFNVSIDYRAEQVVSDLWPLNTLDVSAVLDDRRFSVFVNRIKLRGGELDGEIVRDLQSQPVVTQIRNLKRLDLQKLQHEGNEDSPRTGQMAARVALSVAGTTPSSMRSSVDGVLVALMTGDWLDTVLQSALGIELAESLMVERGVPDKAGQECAFIELQAIEGIVQLRSLVFDTDTIVYLGEGELDWKHQSIDLTIEPHYKKIAAGADAVEAADVAEDAVYVSGALSAPVVESVHPFLTRDSAVSVLDATITPAVALMPFLSEYSDASGVPCQGLAGALDDPQ